MDRQERYEALYNKVQTEMKELNIANTLFELCSVSLDRTGKENQVNLEFLLEPTLDAKTALNKSFDMHCGEFGFTMNYVNLTGRLY